MSEAAEGRRWRRACGQGRAAAGVLVLVMSALASRVECGPPGPPPGAATAAPAVIHQEIDLRARPDRVYAALLDAKLFASITGGLATEITAEAGGAFSCFGAHIVGRNVELVPNRRIVQAWRVTTWPEGVYSIARFELRPRGEGTSLVFDHTGFPSELREHLAQGWEDHYWKALRTLQ